VYAPKLHEAGAYVAENDASGQWRAVSVAELARLSGIDTFPALPPAAKKAMTLPDPERGRRGEVATREPAGPIVGGAILERLKNLLASFFRG
jgi:endonuclease G